MELQNCNRDTLIKGNRLHLYKKGCAILRKNFVMPVTNIFN